MRGEIEGLVGLRPQAESVTELTCPPYDVIKSGTPLEQLLRARKDSLVHVTLGQDPKSALDALVARAALTLDSTSSYYVSAQTFTRAGTTQTRWGVFAAIPVSPYEEGHIIRHEKTFDEKVHGRIALAEKLGLTAEPIFLLTRAKLQSIYARLTTETPIYDFHSDFSGHNDLDDVHTRVFRVPVVTAIGQSIEKLLRAESRYYIADGHHRYHAALLGKQTHTLAYITENATIEAYNRVVRGTIAFGSAIQDLTLTLQSTFATPSKHAFSIYHRGLTYRISAQEIPDGVVERLDCSILERELYPRLGLTHSMVKDISHFDYYPESQLAEMKNAVDSGTYDIAIALHPVTSEELFAVADQGLLDGGQTVMPEKSTFFAPKILSGLILYKHRLR